MSSTNAVRGLAALAAAAAVASGLLSVSSVSGCTADSRTTALDSDGEAPVADGSADAPDTSEADAPDTSLHPAPQRDGVLLLEHRIGHIVQLAATPARLDLAAVGCVLADAAETAANGRGRYEWNPPIPPPKCRFIDQPNYWKTEPVDGGLEHRYDFTFGTGGGTYVKSRGHIAITPPAVGLKNIQGSNDRMGEGFDTTDTATFSLSESHIEGVLTGTGESRVGNPDKRVVLPRTLTRVAVDVSYSSPASADAGGGADGGSDASADAPFCITSGTIEIEGIVISWPSGATYPPKGPPTKEPYRVKLTWSGCSTFTCTYSLPEASDNTEKPCSL